MAKIGNFMQEIEHGIVEIAENNFTKIKNDVIADGINFLFSIEDDIKSWTIMLTLGNLSEDEFNLMVKGKRDLAELTTLKEIGLAKTQLDKLVNDILDMIISKAVSLII